MNTTNGEKTASAADIKRAEDIKILLDRWVKKKRLENSNQQLESEPVEKVNKVWKTRSGKAIHSPS